MRAGQLVRIGVVDDDVAVASQRGRRTVAREADGSRKPDRAVLVGILEPGVNEHRGGAAVETQLEIVFGDSRNAHGPYCRRALSAVSTAGRVQLMAVRVTGPTRGVLWADTIVRWSSVLPLGCVTVELSAVTAQPDDRRPQWMQRRNIVPDSHHAL